MEVLINRLEPVELARGRPTNRISFLFASSLLHLRKERYLVSDEMLANLQEAHALCREWGDLKARIECQFELGFLHLWRNELNEAEQNLQTALDMAETSRNFFIHTLSLTYLTVQHRLRGKVDQVSEYIQLAQQAAEAAHMPDYIAAAKANQAWLAWRRQDQSAAKQLGQEALQLWRNSPLVYPFQWLALFPLIASALANDCQDEALAFAQALLDPTQQCLPDELNDVLQAAVLANAEQYAGTARAHLERAIKSACEIGYL